MLHSDYVYWVDKAGWSPKTATCIFRGIDPDSAPHWDITELDYGSDLERYDPELFSLYRLVRSWIGFKPGSAGMLLPLTWIRMAERRGFGLSPALTKAVEEKRRRNTSRFVARGRQVEGDPQTVETARWPWGDHETELLQILAQAAANFWSLYDPSEKSTAPTNKQVATWIKSQKAGGKPVSHRVALVIAQILRADDLPPGPRK